MVDVIYTYTYTRITPSGIGKGIVMGLAASGADIVIAARDEKAMQGVVDEIRSTYGRKVVAVRCDVLVKSDLQAAVQKCKDEFGHLDILVPNSGIGSNAGGKEAQDMSEETFDMTMNTNFRSVFLLCQMAFPLLKDSTFGGKIITIGSEYSIHGSPKGANYASAKHAIVGMTKSLAVGWAKYNIQVNCLIPGVYIQTPQYLQF